MSSTSLAVLCFTTLALAGVLPAQDDPEESATAPLPTSPEAEGSKGTLPGTRGMDWETDWDPEVKLWWHRGPGKSKATMSLPRARPVVFAGSAILTAAQLGQLDRIDVSGLLGAVRHKQCLEPRNPTFGNICWYWEDDTVTDNNSGFFLGMALSLVRLEYADLLAPDDLKLLDLILRDITTGMKRRQDSPKPYYPNMYLGDLVTRWVLAESLHDEKEMSIIAPQLATLVRQYQRGGWGWGEDLSDIYSKILSDQLSTLAVISRKIPDDLRHDCLDLLNHLLWIEDQFAPAPRVPALRSYSFLQTPISPRPGAGIKLGGAGSRGYRDSIHAWGPETIVPINHVTHLGHLLYTRRWHELVNKPAPRQRLLTVPCFDGAVAMARVEEDFRVGCMSSFPLMPTAENPSSGLSWQCMPVAMWHRQGDWGYLQWFARFGGKSVGLPSLYDHRADPQKMLYVLAPSLSPSIIPRTYGLMRGGGVIVLRRMPMVTSEWTQVGDRLRIVSATANATESPGENGWSRLMLDFPGREVVISFLDPWRRTVPQLRRTDPDTIDWGVELGHQSLTTRRGLSFLWAIHPDGTPAQPPDIKPIPDQNAVPRGADERGWILDWQWPEYHWRLRIDPLSLTPLTELPVKE